MSAVDVKHQDKNGVIHQSHSFLSYGFHNFIAVCGYGCPRKELEEVFEEVTCLWCIAECMA